MPTHGPNRIPPDITAIIRTFTSEPSTGTPDQVLNRANSEKMAVTASNSFGELCRLVQQFAKQADTDEKEQADKH
ncbi:hypothetical protein OkiPb00207_40900 [Escherichia coli]